MLKKLIAQLLLYFIQDHLHAEVCNSIPNSMEGYQPVIKTALIALKTDEQPPESGYTLEEPMNLIAQHGTLISAQSLVLVSDGEQLIGRQPVLYLPKPLSIPGEALSEGRTIQGRFQTSYADITIDFEIDQDGTLWLMNEFLALPTGEKVYVQFSPYLAATPITIKTPTP